MKKINSLLIILFILLKQISTQCYEPINLLKNKNRVKKVECGKWKTDITDDKFDKLVGNLSINGSMFQINFTCLLVNQDELCNKARKAFNNAGTIISNTLRLKEQITVNATLFDFCKGQSDLTCPIEDRKVIGTAGPTRFYSLLDDDDKLERIYPQALVKQFQFQIHPKYDEYDMIAIFNSRIPFHFTDDIHPISEFQYDFDYVVTHELIHGLGFMSVWDAYIPPNGSIPTALWPAITVLDGGVDGNVEPAPDQPVTVKETIFNKFMIRLDNRSFTSEYTKQIEKYFLDNKNVTEFINFTEFEQTYQFQLMKEMLRLSTTPNSIGFLPHDSSDAVILETAIKVFNVGLSLSHVDLLTYNNTSDFLMVYKATPGKTFGNMIGPKLKSILETIGYATEDYPDSHRPQPFRPDDTFPIPTNSVPNSAILNSNSIQFYITIFIIIVSYCKTCHNTIPLIFF